MSKQDEVKERLANLEKILETAKGKHYIADLKLSIEGCKRQLGYLEQNPSGVEFVNGV